MILSTQTKNMVRIISYSALSIPHHRYLHATAPCMKAHVPREPEQKKKICEMHLMDQRLNQTANELMIKVNIIEPLHKIYLHTLFSSFKLLRDITILLSSSICLLNVRRGSSSCKKED